MGFFSPAPYHILSYGTLLGTTFFHPQTFVGGIISFRVLPRPQFGALMAEIFPVYFAMQAVLPAVLVLTYPAGGVAGVLDPVNRWDVLVPLAGVFLCALANLAVVGPATTRVMEERRRLEKKDVKRADDAPTRAQESLALNKKFSMLHGISSLLNLGSFVATVIYGVTLSGRLS
ncbi:93780643-4fa9-414d-a7eb-54f520ccabf7 [Thermothielavioides terrestris]|uniref:TMEM205-like domain-containing protein n=2 Tax=Thermothielavioides terrestris TaxID=2587410 RepID=G2RC64_THETT|nr:uncharacterized protein THITE_2090876 [Thermothielavioides terrestris NRRL 8126]AEO69385.1 hypothetical protein THITE_2090876 [Thermothielavioides terrestris NRRL 8126]SPQ22347.1 93780643-4fa9-414d-a7eb-54f520ccabf7 [Thermothielavioides terrestris]